MALVVKHPKVNNIAAWSQSDLNDQIAQGNYPPGTTLNDITLSTDWNTNHTVTGTIDNTQLLGSPLLALPTILITGDSTASQAASLAYQVSGSTTGSITSVGRPVAMIDRILGGGLNYDTCIDPSDNKRHGSNAGVGGASITEVTVRLVTGDYYTGGIPLLSRPEKYIWVQDGTNDCNGGGTALGQAGFLPQMIINKTAQANAILNAGKQPIFTTILPRNSTDGANNWGTAGGTTAAQKRLVMNGYNTWLVDFCRENGIVCIAWHGVVSDPATGDMFTGYTVDGLHPNDKGGWYLAQYAIEKLAFLYPRGIIGQINLYDAYDAAYNPYGNPLNGGFSGSNASPGTQFVVGTGTGTVTGILPDSWQLQKATATTTSCVASKVVRNGYQAVKLVWTSLGTGVTSEDWRYNSFIAASTSLTGFAIIDDIINFGAIFEVEGGHGGIMRSPYLRFGMNSGITVGPKTTISFDAATNRILDSANGLATMLPNRVFNIAGAGTAANNRVFRILTVDPGGAFVTVDPAYVATPSLTSGNVTTEVAGNSITIRLASLATVTNSSVERFPDEDTGMYIERCPTFIVPNTGNVSPRAGFFIDGTIAGTCTAYVYGIKANKRSFKPAVLNYIATDL